MNIWDPFQPVAYFLHVTLGVAGVLGAIVALLVLKGSNSHVLAGRAFVVAAAVAATTAISFSFTNFAPMAIASGIMTLAAIGSAMLALRDKSPSVATGELLTTMLMALATLWLLFGVILSLPLGGLLWIPPALFALLPAALVVNDLRFMKKDDAGRRSIRIRRHFSRMAFALAIAIHAPIVVFADDLRLHPGVAFYTPFIIWPLIFFYFKSRISNGRLVIANRNAVTPAQDSDPAY